MDEIACLGKAQDLLVNPRNILRLKYRHDRIGRDVNGTAHDCDPKFAVVQEKRAEKVVHRDREETILAAIKLKTKVFPLFNECNTGCAQSE